MSDAFFSVRNLTVNYGSIVAVNNVTFLLKKGEIVGVVGPNGAGKSSLLKALSGLVKINQGEITLEGQRIENLTVYDRLKRGITICLQGRRIFTNLTVEENLLIGGYNIDSRRMLTNRLDWVYSVFPLLKDKRSKKGGELSGGEQQVLAIGRALMGVKSVRLILFDEPTMGLAPQITVNIMNLIKEIHKELHSTILIVEHNFNILKGFIDRLFLMVNGELRLDTTSVKGISEQDLLHLYMRKESKNDK